MARYGGGVTTSWRPVTFEAMWRAAVDADGDALFLRFEDRDGDVTDWSYGDFDRVVEGAAHRLADAGVGRGGAVHLALTNSPSFVAVWLAAVRLGVDRAVRPDGDAPSSPSTSGARRPPSGSAPPSGPDVYRAAGDPRSSRSTSRTSASTGLTPADRRRARPSRLGDRAAVMFTSGTTGRPKGSRSPRPTTPSPGRRWRRRATSRPRTASSSCCRCSTPTPSTTRSPRRSPSAPAWR